MKRSERARACIAIVSLALVVSGSALATSTGNAGVGVVADYRPTSARYRITRPPSGEVVAVRIGTVVAKGDEIRLPAGGSITVYLSSGKVERFEGKGQGESSFAIPDSTPLDRFKAAIFGSIKALFDSEYRLEGTAAARGGAECGAAGAQVKSIDIPMLVPGARIVAGKRDLPLAWHGGCAPFAASVRSGETIIAERTRIDAQRIRLDGVMLAKGTYSVAIVDAGGRKFEAQLEVTDVAPTIPAGLASESSPLGVVAQALWLAEQDGGRWRLESFEKLRPLIRAGDPFAGTIADGLLWSAATP